MGLLLWFSLFEYVYIFQSSKSEMYMCLIQLFFWFLRLSVSLVLCYIMFFKNIFLIKNVLKYIYIFIWTHQNNLKTPKNINLMCFHVKNNLKTL